MSLISIDKAKNSPTNIRALPNKMNIIYSDLQDDYVARNFIKGISV